MFATPTKGDIDRMLSDLMHYSHQQLRAEAGRIKSEAAAANVLHGSCTVVLTASAADKIHKHAMKSATALLIKFARRVDVSPSQIIEWARPHLENLGNTLLAQIPGHFSPTDGQKTQVQYRAVFAQRLDGALRDVEIGRAEDSGFSGAVEQDSWVSAPGALELLEFTLGHGAAAKAICERANDGMIRAKADRFIRDRQSVDNAELPPEFWWARGEAALEQNWRTGDFETWIDQKHYLRAYGVRFRTADIKRMIPDLEPTEAIASRQAPASDRVVRLDHNHPDYGKAVAEFESLEEAVRGSNDYENEEDKQQRIAEISAGRKLLSAIRVRAEPLIALVYRGLQSLVKKFADNIIGIIAAGLIALLGRLTGFW